MKIRVRKGLTVRTVEVDSICSCNGHAIAQKVDNDCKISYYTRDSGQLFWTHKNSRKQKRRLI